MKVFEIITEANEYDSPDGPLEKVPFVDPRQSSRAAFKAASPADRSARFKELRPLVNPRHRSYTPAKEYPATDKIDVQPKGKSIKSANASLTAAESARCQELADAFMESAKAYPGHNPETIIGPLYKFTVGATTNNGLRVEFATGKDVNKFTAYRVLGILSQVEQHNAQGSKKDIQHQASEAVTRVQNFLNQSVALKNPFNPRGESKPDRLTAQSQNIKVPSPVTAEFYNTFWQIVESLEQLGDDISNPKKSGRSAMSMVTPSKGALDYYMKLSKNLIDSWWHGQRWALSRGGEGSGFDQYDNLITIGYTKEGYGITQQEAGKNLDKEKSSKWREHVVPCDLINKMGVDICNSMLADYKPLQGKQRDIPQEAFSAVYPRILKLIQRNLAIVICSKEEANYLDRTMGWQTTMPPGWKDGDDILARFIQCKGYPNKDSKGIPVYGVKTGKRISEDAS